MKSINLSITDDNESDLIVLEKIIHNPPKHQIILKTYSGIELLYKHKEFLINLAIIDYKMPLNDGIQTARLLFDNGFNGKILVVSHGFSSNAPKLLKEIGADGFCSKEITQIKVAISEIEKGEKYFNTRIYEEWEIETRKKNLLKKDENINLQKLNSRDIKIITLHSQGLNYTEIAEELYLGKRTIEGLMAEICKKLELNSKQITTWAALNGIVNWSDVAFKKKII